MTTTRAAYLILYINDIYYDYRAHWPFDFHDVWLLFLSYVDEFIT